jgi:hypothetical protein
MKVILAGLSACLVIACGSSSEVNATFYLDPPKDDRCIGVAGFDILVTATGQASQPAQLPQAAPILSANACKMTHPFTIGDLDIDTPVTVTITGLDGARTPRVTATKTIDSLHDSPAHLVLETVNSPPLPVLVIHRTLLLQGAPLSSLQSVSVSTQKKPMGILTAVREPANVYFDVEPGAYGVPADGLAAGGMDEGAALSVTFSTADGKTIKPPRLSAHWIDPYYEVKQQ